jgi:predicted nucleic acid-binding protein
MGEGDRSAVPQLQEILPDVEIAVPAHWPIEFSNFLCTRLKKNQMTVDHIHLVLERLDILQVFVDPPIETDEMGPLAIFSSEHGLTSYDGAYVQLAFHRKAVLATFDAAMRQAAQRLAIPLLPA